MMPMIAITTISSTRVNPQAQARPLRTELEPRRHRPCSLLTHDLQSRLRVPWGVLWPRVGCTRRNAATSFQLAVMEVGDVVPLADPDGVVREWRTGIVGSSSGPAAGPPP